MSIEFSAIDFDGTFDCECSLQRTSYKATATPKSMKIECMKCHKIRFYRRTL